MTGPEPDELTELLLLASRAFVAITARSLADLEDVTVPQFRCLVVLSEPDHVTVGSLARELAIHPSTATRMCDRLVRKGLIIRQPGTGGDRREVNLALTARGRRLLEWVTRRRRRELARIVDQMSEADRHHALLGVRAFSAAAGHEGTDALELAGAPVGPDIPPGNTAHRSAGA